MSNGIFKKFETDTLGKAIVALLSAIIFIIVIYTGMAEVAPDLGAAGDNMTLTNTPFPLASFFKRKGVIILAMMAGVVITIIGVFLKPTK